MEIRIYQKGTRRGLLVVEAADYTKTEHRYRRYSVRVNRQRSPSKLVSRGSCDDHRQQLNTGKDHRYHEGILVAGILDLETWSGKASLVAQGMLTEICRVGVKHRQTKELLSDLWPPGDNEPNEIATLENGPMPNLCVAFCDDALLGDSCRHDFLGRSDWVRMIGIRTICSWTSYPSIRPLHRCRILAAWSSFRLLTSHQGDSGIRTNMMAVTPIIAHYT